MSALPFRPLAWLSRRSNDSTRDLAALESEGLARNLFTVAALRVVVVSVALLSVVVTLIAYPPLEDDIGSWQFQLIGATYALSVLYLVLLRVPRLVTGLAYTQIALDVLLVTALVYMTQGIESPFAFAYVFVILAASSTLYRQGALIAAAATILMFGSVLAAHALQISQILPPLEGRWQSAVFSFLGHSAGMVAVAFLASALAEKLRATGRKLAQKETAFEELSQLHTAILRSLPAGVLSVDDLGHVRFGNDAAMQILRCPEHELVGRHLGDAVPVMAPAWAKMRDSHFRESGGRSEVDFTRADGETIRIGFSVAPLDLESELNAIIVFQDVTDILRLKDAVARSERLALIGRFAAGLAHEVRNPLASMCASVDVLKGSLAPPENLSRLMDNVTREAERLNGLISDFLVLARPRKLEAVRADVGELVGEVLDLLEHDQRLENISLVRRLDGAVAADVDPDLMKQVVWNLTRNAIEALEAEGGRLSVEVYESGDRACIQITDDGPGVSPELLQKIFDPFYTTKERGSGLGLAISNSIVEAHGATMIFDSALGRGTTVTIRMAPSEAPSTAVDEAGAEQPA